MLQRRRIVDDLMMPPRWLHGSFGRSTPPMAAKANLPTVVVRAEAVP